MKDSIKLAIGLIAMVFVMAVALLIIRRGNTIPENDPLAIGNTAGNLYNDGLFCEDDGKVYFSNVYDDNSMYVMNPDETDIKKISKINSKWINAEGNYLYFYQASDGAAAIAGFGGRMMGLYRTKKDGSDGKCLDKTPCGTIALAGNDIYYEHYTNTGKEGMTLYKISTNKKDQKQVAKEIIDPSCVVMKGIYYAGMNGDHNMYYLDLDTGNSNEVFNGSVWNPVVLSDANTFYYMKVDDDYKIHRASIFSGEDIAITDCRVDCFNVTDSYIYYQKNDKEEPAIMRCGLNGENPEVIMPGNYTSINATSRYVYFIPYGTSGQMFRTPVSGPVSVSDFSAAKNAVTE